METLETLVMDVDGDAGNEGRCLNGVHFFGGNRLWMGAGALWGGAIGPCDFYLQH